MKRLLSILLLVVGSSLCAQAQKLHIEYHGVPIPSVYSVRIERVLNVEENFYGPAGLPDTTMTVKLYAFKDAGSGNAFIRQYDPMAYGKSYCGGMFISSAEIAVLNTTEDMDRAVCTLFHEISHFLYHQIMDSSAVSASWNAYSLNEGLAEYFAFLKVKKDGTVFQKPDNLYLNSVKTLLEIDEFNLDEYLRMNQSEFLDKHRHDGQVSYHVSYVIVAALFDKLGNDGMIQLLSMVRDGISYENAVESLYPGGKMALEEDIRSKVGL